MKQCKELPLSVTKKQLIDMYIGQMPEYRIRKGIKQIMIDAGQNPNFHQVQHSEFKEFYQTYGKPNGYFKTDDE